MSQHPKNSCPDCDDSIRNSGVTRRGFLQQAGTLAGSAALFMGPLHGAFAAPSRSSKAETAAQRLYELLTPQQRAQICFPFDHPSRTRISANWAVTKPAIFEDFFTDEQRGLIREAFQGLTSESGHKRFEEQMEFDDGGFDRYHIALFGNPESSQFEWLITGRHVTLRADGNSTQGMAFGGPVVYGHGEETAKDNLFYYQTQKANEVFKALDSAQAKKALLNQPPGETQVSLQGTGGQFSGLQVKDLASDQQELVKSVIQVLLDPFREEDISESMECIEKAGGLGSLNMAFYKAGDLNSDGEWDIWRIEGPSFVCHFRGAPHVHAYLNIGTVKLS